MYVFLYVHVCLYVPKYPEYYSTYRIKTNTIVIVEVQARTNCLELFLFYFADPVLIDLLRKRKHNIEPQLSFHYSTRLRKARPFWLHNFFTVI